MEIERPKKPFRLAKDRDPWERQPGLAPDPALDAPKQRPETAHAYAAFIAYRAQPAHRRSLRELAKTLSRSSALVMRWSVAWQWQFRVAQWDARQEEDRLADLRAQSRRSFENWVGQGKALQRLGSEVLARTKQEGLTFREAVQAVRTGVLVERAGLLGATDRGRGLDAAEILGDGEGEVVVADGTEEQYVGAIRRVLKAEGRLPEDRP